MIQRVVLPVLLGIALLVGVLTLWQRGPRGVEPPPRPSPTASFSPASPQPTPTPAVVAESGYRLAGTAVGDPVSYAAIEDPDGESHLYRSDEEIPGLGRISEIHEDRIVILQASQGSLTLRLKPAATPTLERRRLNGEASAPAATPTERPAPDDTPRESPSSNAPDRPAS